MLDSIMLRSHAIVPGAGARTAYLLLRHALYAVISTSSICSGFRFCFAYSL